MKFLLLINVKMLTVVGFFLLINVKIVGILKVGSSPNGDNSVQIFYLSLSV